jgi:hypothetical protein
VEAARQAFVRQKETRIVRAAQPKNLGHLASP